MAKTIAELEVIEEKLRNAYFAAQAKWKRANDILRNAQRAEEEKTALTLATALESRVASGENVRGYKFLEELTWKGAWYKTGLQGTGSNWTNTQQHVLRVALNHKMTDEQLEKLESLILDVIPLVKPGVFEPGKLKLAGEGCSTEASTLRVLDIFEHNLSEFANWALAQMDDGNWVIFDQRIVERDYGRARFTGTLQECLQEIRAHLWYDGGITSDYDD